ncbi:hypothetical protein ADJ73_11155 [Arsenicicoccus sp. oral taxon 190]|nr:hypothetical protein ADJ73_11155 [Arsenicicoccus sp. oral taxon 190]
MRAAVLGSPVAHSLSPAMHRAAYAHLGLTDWRYDRRECREPELAPLLASLDETWRGLSLTMPLKEEAARLATTVDAVAQEVGGANTLVRRPDDGWDAYNTDVHGISQALRAAGITDVESVLLLGSGATARSVIAAVAQMGATLVTFATRSGTRPETLAYARSLGLVAPEADLDQVAARVPRHDLLVNTLPGTAADPVAATLADLRPLPALFEVVYEGWPTALARTFAAAGSPVASGLDMLAHQAARQVELMTGRSVPAAVLLDAARSALG